MQDDLIMAAVRAAFSQLGEDADEAAFQKAVAKELGSAERELRLTFAPAAVPLRRPPPEAIAMLADEGKQLAPEGKDPCSRAAKLDVLWDHEGLHIPIELKFRLHRNSDTYGYMFLKDLHRLERVVKAGQHELLSETRYSIFVTRESVYWEGRRPEPQPFWLRDGSSTEKGQWFQYDQTSADTLWWRYPPFHLANTYTFRWQDLGRGAKVLLLRVHPQGA